MIFSGELFKINLFLNIIASDSPFSNSAYNSNPRPLVCPIGADMKVEEITPLEYSTLLEIHKTNRANARCPTVHILLLEIARLHQIVRDLERGFRSMRTVWREEVGGDTVGMHQIRVMLQHEMNLYGAPLHPREAEAKELLLKLSDNRRFAEGIKVLANVRKNKTS